MNATETVGAHPYAGNRGPEANRPPATRAAS